MNDTVNYIPARLKNAAVGGYVAEANDIYDEDMARNQSELNARFEESYNKAPVYIKNVVTSNTVFTLPIEGSAINNNKQTHVLYYNNGSSEITLNVPVSNFYKLPENKAIEIKIPAGGFAEVNCLVLDAMVWVRAM